MEERNGTGGAAVYVATVTGIAYPIVAVGSTAEQAERAATALLISIAGGSWLACDPTHEAVRAEYSVGVYGPLLPGEATETETAAPESGSGDLFEFMERFDSSMAGATAGEEARSRFPRGSVWWDVEPGADPDPEEQTAAVELLTAAFSRWAEEHVPVGRRAAAVAYYREQTTYSTEG